MQIHNTTAPQAVPIRNGIIMLSGYGIRVSVDSRHLSVVDGVGRARRASKFAKATSRPRRLVIMGQTGFITLEALRWLSDVRCAFVQLDYDASILTASISGLDDARLRRAQAFATLGEDRIAMTKALLLPKVRGQAAVLNSFALASGDAVSVVAEALDRVVTVESMLLAEAQAAEAYWLAWEDVTMQFAKRPPAPTHWGIFGTRRSALTSKPRNAANPINSMLNYLYALLEVETRLALIIRGLDPGMGLFHADSANRQSLAADVMEPVRPHVDAYVLSLLQTRTFSAKDFIETREGGCRLTSSLAQDLANTMPMWRDFVAPHAEVLARALMTLAKRASESRSTRLDPKRGRMKIRATPIAVRSEPKVVNTVPISAVRNACRECGARVTVRKRLFCDECLPKRRAEQQASIESFQGAGPAKLAALRAQGIDPTHTPDATKRRVRSAIKQRKAVVQWTDDGALRGVDFKKDILPAIQPFSTTVLAETMGTTISHASKVRSGYLTPHKRHWRRLIDITHDKRTR